MLTWKDVKPKSFVDTMSMGYCMVMVHSAYIYAEVVIVPWLQEVYSVGPVKMFFYQTLALYLYMNFMGNIYKIITTNTSTTGKMLPTLLKPVFVMHYNQHGTKTALAVCRSVVTEDFKMFQSCLGFPVGVVESFTRHDLRWRFCYACEANSPPRSFHCLTCNKCILKRDHHCMFTGKCIGQFNYRYYFWLVFYGWCGTVFCATMTLPYVLGLLGDFAFYKIAYFILPLFCFIFQLLPFTTALSTFITFLSAVFSLALTGLLIWHGRHIYRGQVTYESTHKILLYDLGLKENIVQNFGSRWYLTWICPWVVSPLPSDGMEFVTKQSQTYEGLKKL